MTTPSPALDPVCPLDRLEPERGVAALVDGRRWRCSAPTTELYAVDNLDPFSGAYVLSRGIVGSRGGAPTVASPLHKQVFDLRTGRCLDLPGRVPCRPVRGALPGRPGRGAAATGGSHARRTGRLHRRGHRRPATRRARRAAASGAAPGWCWHRPCGSSRSPTTPNCAPPPAPASDRPPDMLLATTGIGMRGWLEAAEGWGLAEPLRDALARRIHRGPRAQGARRDPGRRPARPVVAADSESCDEVVDAPAPARAWPGRRIAVQLHGERQPEYTDGAGGRPAPR